MTLIKEARKIYGNRLTAFALAKKSTKELDVLVLTERDIKVLRAMLEFQEVLTSRHKETNASALSRGLMMGGNFYEPRIDKDNHSAPVHYLHKISLGEIVDEPGRILASARNYVNDVWL